MPDFNFQPSLMSVHFERGQSSSEPISEIKLKKPSEGLDVFELSMILTFGGLDYLYDPVTHYIDGVKNYRECYVNILTYTQRGQRDAIVNGLYTVRFDEEILKKGSHTLQLTLTKFRNDEPSIYKGEIIRYNYVSTIYSVKVFVSENDNIDEGKLHDLIYDEDSYPVLFNTKIPFVSELDGE